MDCPARPRQQIGESHDTQTCLLAPATFGLAIGQASAADLPRKSACLYTAGAASDHLDGMLYRRQHRRSIWRRQCDFQFWRNLYQRFWLCRGRSDWLRLSIRRTGWVIGFRDMFDGTSNKRSGTINTLSGPVVANFNNQWFDTLTGRLGYEWHQPGCFTSRAARPGVIPVQTSPLVVFRLARPPGPEQAGQLVVALNGCSRRTGLRFWKGIGWTSAVPQEPRSPQQVSLSVRSGVPGASKRPRPLSWSA